MVRRPRAGKEQERGGGRRRVSPAHEEGGGIARGVGGDRAADDDAHDEDEELHEQHRDHELVDHLGRDVDGATRGWQSNNEARIGTQVGAFKVHARACEGARAPLGARAQAPLGLWRCSRATQGPRCDAAHGPQGYPRGSPRTHREVARLGHLRADDVE